jgi:hypothetical protein
MAGKKVGKYVTVILDDTSTARTISNDITAINGLPVNYGKIEVGGFGQDMSYLIGRGDSEVQLTGLVNDTTNTGFHQVIKDILGDNAGYTLTIQIGDNTTATTGDPEFEGEFCCHAYVVTPDLNGAVTGVATLVPYNGNTLPAWGTVG